MTRNPNSPRRSSLRPELLAGLALLVGGWCVISFVPAFRVWLPTRFGDLHFYAQWGNETSNHLTPYKDFPLEYPPGSLPAFTLPVYLRKVAGYHWDYFHWFRVEVLAFWALMLVAVAWALRSVGVTRRHASVALGFTGASLLLLGPIAVSRYDVWPALFTAVAVAALVARRGVLACAAIAAGFVVKIYPIVLLPIALVELWRARGRRGLAEGIGATAAVSLAGFGPFLVLAPHGLWHGLWRQASRPVQIESLVASFWAFAHIFGLHVHSVTTYGSDNLVASGADTAGTVSSIVLVLALVAVWVRFARGRGGGEAIVVACAAAVVAYVAFAKVFSPQYLVWLFPLVPLVRGIRPTLLLAAITGMTQIWEPYHYRALYKHFDTWVSLLLVARDLLVVALLFWLYRYAKKLDAGRAAAVG